jgi:hypothetical protein
MSRQNYAPMCIRFDGASAVIALPLDPRLLDALQVAAAGWSFKEVAAPEAPTTVVLPLGESEYEVHSPAHEPTPASAVGAACCIMVDVVDDMITKRPATLWLHCGSVLLNGRLVIFPSHSHAGKSTLMGRLSERGHKVFGDDILPLAADDEKGVGLGIAPRLRLPLPASASEGFRRFVGARTGASDEQYAYLRLEDAELARHGEEAALGAIVLLDRHDGESARFLPADRAAVLLTLVNQNFTSGEPADRLLARLHVLMDRLPSMTLRYSDLDAAVDAIEAMFADWPPSLDMVEDLSTDIGRPRLVRPGEEDALQVVSGTPRLPTSTHALSRSDGISIREVDGELFLAGVQGEAIYHLNPLGAGIWNLLAEPHSQEEIAQIVAGAFPDVERPVIEADVSQLLAGLMSIGMIEVHSSR